MHYQIPVKKTSTKKMMSRPAFQLGIKDAEAGRGFDEKYEKFSTTDQWTYERGRQFYFTVGKMRLKQGNGISRTALIAYNTAREMQAVL